ncbi:MAG: 50S ribosomal protein L24 [Gemmatimonadetes bacterium]|nr:50S ribosomal protein L24 [Gemmatimonadota bacterium]
MSITRGDTVQVIRGDDKGKRGKVLQVLPKKGMIKVEGINIVTRHLRPTQQREGGIVRSEAPFPVSKAMLVDPKTGAPTRIRHKRDAEGRSERIAVKSGQAIPRNR